MSERPHRLSKKRRGSRKEGLRALSVLAALLASESALALSVQQLPRLVADHNRDVVAAKADMDAAEFGRTAARGKYFPKVDWTTTYSHLNGKLELELDPISATIAIPGRDIPVNVQPPPIEIQKQDMWKSTVTVVQPLYAGGRISAANDAAEASEKEAGLTANALHDEQTRNAMVRYFQAQASAEALKVLTDMQGNLSSLNTLSHKLVDTGVVPKFSVMQIEVAQAELQARLEEAEARKSLALTALQTAIGAAVGTITHLESPLTLVPCPQGLAFFQKEALTRRSELGLLAAKAQSVEALKEAQQGEMLPTLAAYGKFEVLDKYLTALEPSWVAGLTLTIPVTAGLEKWPERQRAEALAAKVAILTQKAREEIPLQVQAFHTEVMGQREVLKAIAKGTEQAQEALRLARRRFETGQGSTLEVLNSSNDLEKMRLKRIEALENYNRNLVSLYAAAGDVHGYLAAYQQADAPKEGK